MKRILGVVVILVGAFGLAPAAWVTVVAIAGVVAGVVQVAPGLILGAGTLCGMVCAFLVAITSGLVARGLFKSAAADAA